MSVAYAGSVGTVGILNVGAGDTKLSFDKSNPAERIRAARIVKDMLRRGYALLVEVEVDGVKKFTRALDFDENVCEYIIADLDSSVSQPEEEHAADSQETPRAGATAPAPEGRRAYRKKRVDAETTRSVAVARTAGG
jgi:hypothetical protein